MKKLSRKTLSLVLALVLIVSIVSGTMIFSAAAETDFEVTVTPATLPVSDAEQTASVTISRKTAFDTCAISGTIQLPEGWTLTGEPSHSNAGFDDNDYYSGSGIFMITTKSTDDIEGVTELVTFGVTIPANAAAGNYEIKVTELEALTDHGLTIVFGNETCTARLTIGSAQPQEPEFSVAFEPATLLQSTSDQTVKMTVTSSVPLTASGIGFTVGTPAAWTLTKIENTENNGVTYTDDDYANNKLLWGSDDAEDVSGIKEIATITFTVPAGVFGSFDIPITNLLLVKNYGRDIVVNNVTVQADSPFVITENHEHSYTSVVTPATCEEGGYTTYTCACGETYIGDETQPLGHNYVGEETIPATCGEPGVMTYTCENDASHNYTEPIPATGRHTDADNDNVCDVCGAAIPAYELYLQPSVSADKNGNDLFDVMPGDTFTLDLVLKCSADRTVEVVQAYFTYDSDKLEHRSSTTDAFTVLSAQKQIIFNFFEMTSGQALTAEKDVPLTLGTLTFKVKDGATGPMNFEFNEYRGQKTALMVAGNSAADIYPTTKNSGVEVYKQYTIIWDANDNGKDDGDKTSTADLGGQIAKPAEVTDPTKEGHDFKGWDIDGDGEADITATAASTAIPADAPDEIIAKPVFEQKEYTVTWNHNDKDPNPTKVEETGKHFGDEISAPDPAPTRTGYDFKGWTDANGGDVAFPTNMPAEDVEYTAKWEKKTYTITWDADDNDDPTGDTTTTVQYGEKITAPVGAAVPAKDGYTFIGWDLDGDKDTAELNENTTEADIPDPDEQEITAKPLFEATEYTITFDAAGGDNVASKTYTILSEDKLPSASRTSYAFIGWKVTTAGGNWTADDILPADTALTGKYGDVTLTAQWGVAAEAVLEKYQYSKTDDRLLIVKAEAVDGMKYEYVANGVTYEMFKLTDESYRGVFADNPDYVFVTIIPDTELEAVVANIKLASGENREITDRDGDVNGSNSTNLIDANVVKQMLIGTTKYEDLTIEQRLVADMYTPLDNQTNRGSIADVNAILSIYYEQLLG